ncbi:DUF177 domain-containing protein [Pikeienuella piscinae]|uniref:DUF177 domain-containing protein n=1 Tax=Pikeienuella piscinae TaxID=2748098 RepID=A0A7L5BV27_9RHOB|nr:YceD family protein [Pikeienuella piscinae]QIE55191.1 DUF177 domain-containing protein [Pikeienuella piscinae]
MIEPSHLFPRFLSLRDLPGLDGREIEERATETERAAIAEAYGLHDLAALRVEARVAREGRDGWRLDGRLVASATQNCVVTLEPVAAEIDEPFVRRLRPMSEEEAAAQAVEIDLDPEAEDPPEPLGDGVDLGAAALETLALALDPYPRAPGAVFAPRASAPRGVAPLTEEDVRPFAALRVLKRGAEGGD